MPKSKPMSNKRQLIFNKTRGHCLYCGLDLIGLKWQADHFHPIIRHPDKGVCLYPKLDTIDNLFASCAACNNFKSSYTVEGFRGRIKEQEGVTLRGSTGLRLLQRMGLVSFRSYWKPTKTSNRKSPVNPMMPMPTTLLTQVKTLVGVMSPIKAFCGRVEDFNWQFYEAERKKNKVVVFIDPPYNNTCGYGFNLDYLNWMDTIINLPDNYEVYITDYEKHSDVTWDLTKTSKGGIKGGNKTRTEILSKIK